MTGIGMAAASGGSVVSPFNANVFLAGGTTFNVSGASGNIYTQGGAQISATASGGTPPYSIGVTPTKDAGNGNVFLTNPGIPNNTVGWSGMAVGDTQIFHIDWSANDSGSPPQTKSGRDPGVGSTYSIHRVS